MDIEAIIRSQNFILKIIDILINEGDFDVRRHNIPRDPTYLERIFNATVPTIFEKMIRKIEIPIQHLWLLDIFDPYNYKTR